MKIIKANHQTHKNAYQLQFLIRQGLDFHSRGKLVDAIEIFSKARDLDPQNVNILNFLGTTELQLGNVKPAIKLLSRAIDIAEKSEFYITRGNAFFAIKKYTKALDDFLAAIKLDRDNVDAHTNASITYFEIGNVDLAHKYIDHAIAIAPTYARLYLSKAKFFQKQKNFYSAIENLNRLIELEEKNFEAYNELGTIFQILGDHHQSLTYFNKAIEVNPFYAKAYNNRSVSFVNLNQLDQALLSLNKAIEILPTYADAYCNRGTILKSFQKYDDGLASIDHAIRLSPSNPEAFNARGNILNDLNRLDEALESFDKAISLNPEYVPAYNNRGNVLKDLSRFDEAFASFDKAVELDPNYAEAHWNKSVLTMLMGDLTEGLAAYEWRKKVGKATFERYPEDFFWDNESDLKGKSLFIYPELYLGDMIQFCRYAVLAKQKGAHVILAAQDSLHALLETLDPAIEIIPQNSIPDKFDFCCSLMSLPFAFKTTMASIPSDVPYLKADPDRIKKWEKRIGREGFKIGICWQGSTSAYSIPMRRSFPLVNFSRIGQLPNVRLISLQKSDGIEQLSELPPDMIVETLGETFDAGPDAFLDTAAVMETLDLIITADTAIAHLAGALARPTWLLLKDVPDWRWFLDRPDSPWYPTLHLFRQNDRDDWSSIFKHIEKKLEKKN